MFTFKLPVSGKSVQWRPLKVGDHIDIDANYSSSNLAHLKKFITLASRVIKIDDKEKAQLGDDLVGMRDWDEYDLVAFNEEVDSRELARAVALMPQRTDGAVVSLEQAISAAQVELTKVATALQRVVQAAKQVEQKTGPLA